MYQLLRIENQDDFQRLKKMFEWKSRYELIYKIALGINQVECNGENNKINWKLEVTIKI